MGLRVINCGIDDEEDNEVEVDVRVESKRAACVDGASEVWDRERIEEKEEELVTEVRVMVVDVAVVVLLFTLMSIGWEVKGSGVECGR